ncbi:MAG: DNA polymerase IV [Hasllibacter sp.]
MPAICRDCLRQHPDAPRRCPACGGVRMLSHPELFELSVAHMDCDAFYASVEKRDDPGLRDKPVIVGGGQRGVVTTACYIARIRGVRSAMPMFQALRLCPEAVIVKPSVPKYVEASKAIRAMMEEMTPAIEPLSLDEAFLDLTGTARLHGAPPAVVLCRLLNRMEAELGLTGSVGLSHNKFLAKLASDLDKPRGFSVIGAAETEDFLAPLPVARIWGVGHAMQARLEKAGVRTFADLRRWDRRDLAARFGSGGERLADLSRGIDRRAVKPDRGVKSISNETTFREDTASADVLDGHIWRMADKVAGRAKAKGLAGRVVTLKLKRANHALLTRRVTLPVPTQLADAIYRHARALYDETRHDGPYRLLGVGLAEIVPEAQADREGDLLDPAAPRRAAAERATDAIRARFGDEAILKGRALR